MSVFTEILQALGEHSAAVDSATDDRFVELQALEARILRAYQNGYFHHAEYTALYTIAQTIHAGYREVLHLDR